MHDWVDRVKDFVKRAGKRNAWNLHAAFGGGRAGNGAV